MSLRMYSGEYLIGPTLLHFGGNWCSHNCQYCFANLNQPGRTADANDVARIYKWYDTGSTSIEFELMRAGHPVMMSNDSDPCSKTNRALFAAVNDASRTLGFAMSYQTRGGEPDAEARIVNQRPTMVYVSLTTDNEEVRQKYEPGAPPHVQRMAFIRRLKAAGHHVVIGLNPFVPSWWDDLDAAFDQLAEWGVSHVWHQAMHMSHIQVAQMGDKGKERNIWLVDYATQKKLPDAMQYESGLAYIESLGFNLFSGGVSNQLGFWDAYFALGYPFSPTLDALVKDCDTHGSGKPIGIDLAEFNAWADVGIKKDRSIWREFLHGFGRSVRNVGEKAEAKSQREVNGFQWRFEEFPTRMRHACFARISVDDESHASDMSGTPLMAVSKDGFADYEVPASDVTFTTQPLKRYSHG